MNVKGFVQDNWSALMKNIGVSETVCNDWWSIIARRYGEEWRFYHTLSHVYHMLQLFLQWRERVANLNVVALAIYFHDIVYDPQTNDNEVRSIALFEKFALDANLASDDMSRVSQMIKATISHSVKDKTDDLDLCLFLDFDLAVLGQDIEKYKMYAEQIRQEYIHLKDEDYISGRTKVLHNLLTSPSLFASEEFCLEYEEQARKNMIEEIEVLRQHDTRTKKEVYFKWFKT